MSIKANIPIIENPIDEYAEPTEASTKSNQSNGGSNFSLWLIVGCIISLIVVLIIDYFVRSSHKKKETELKDLEQKYSDLEQENESLQSEIEQLQTDNKNYVNHINRLADELEARQEAKNPYSSMTPMTENSFEAPDPNAVAQKPQIIKDKEQIRAMVNSKRQTVQDVIDQQQADKKDKNESIDTSTEQEIKDLTHAEDNNENNEENNEDIDTDDKNVNDLMNIIQNQ